MKTLASQSTKVDINANNASMTSCNAQIGIIAYEINYGDNFISLESAIMSYWWVLCCVQAAVETETPEHNIEYTFCFILGFPVFRKLTWKAILNCKSVKLKSNTVGEYKWRRNTTPGPPVSTIYFYLSLGLRLFVLLLPLSLLWKYRIILDNTNHPRFASVATVTYKTFAKMWRLIDSYVFMKRLKCQCWILKFSPEHQEISVYAMYMSNQFVVPGVGLVLVGQVQVSISSVYTRTSCCQCSGGAIIPSPRRDMTWWNPVPSRPETVNEEGLAEILGVSLSNVLRTRQNMSAYSLFCLCLSAGNIQSVQSLCRQQ